MDRFEMMNKIAATLKSGESIEIDVTNARGRTMRDHYKVTSEKTIYLGYTWGGYGNLRDEYKARVLGR